MKEQLKFASIDHSTVGQLYFFVVHTLPCCSTETHCTVPHLFIVPAPYAFTVPVPHLFIVCVPHLFIAHVSHLFLVPVPHLFLVPVPLLFIVPVPHLVIVPAPHFIACVPHLFIVHVPYLFIVCVPHLFIVPVLHLFIVPVPHVFLTGHYCLNGTRVSTEYPCPAGTFNNITGLAADTDCFDCLGTVNACAVLVCVTICFVAHLFMV